MSSNKDIKIDSLVSNYNKKELAEKLVELTEKLEEMKLVEAQVSSSVETLKGGSPAIGLHKKQDGTYQLVKIVYDLSKNAAAIIETVDYGRDNGIAAGKLVKEAGEVYAKASGLVYYK